MDHNAPASGEDALIARYFKPLATDPGALGLVDDAAILQALGSDIVVTTDAVVEGDKYLPAEAAFFKDVVAGVVRDQARLDPLIDDALQKGWPLKRIDAILRAVLRAGSYELEHRKDVPGRVVVSEYVDVANAFVDREETGMVNAVLDQIARQFRADEFARG